MGNICESRIEISKSLIFDVAPIECHEISSDIDSTTVKAAASASTVATKPMTMVSGEEEGHDRNKQEHYDQSFYIYIFRTSSSFEEGVDLDLGYEADDSGSGKR